MVSSGESKASECRPVLSRGFPCPRGHGVAAAGPSPHACRQGPRGRRRAQGPRGVALTLPELLPGVAFQVERAAPAGGVPFLRPAAPPLCSVPCRSSPVVLGSARHAAKGEAASRHGRCTWAWPGAQTSERQVQRGGGALQGLCFQGVLGASSVPAKWGPLGPSGARVPQRCGERRRRGLSGSHLEPARERAFHARAGSPAGPRVHTQCAHRRLWRRDSRKGRETRASPAGE